LELIIKELREKNKRKFKEYIPFQLQQFGQMDTKDRKIKENVNSRIHCIQII